ncbi:hypothetical protein QQS21_011695 [Conoideocrella luteorostrata]|uniref:Uncharacterized protein n=1 Tax=Conoideocrella luteorostrata TaxID=1105319 RepID=A0AAJ0CFF1_9HYPO|nr:hypothetical protein QQS21_011695 [Conoideocrella luteorostrata]
MKYSTFASAAFVAVVAAQPHHGNHKHLHVLRDVVPRNVAPRDIATEVVWVTETEYVTKVIDATTTLWVSSGQPAAATTSSKPPGNFFESPSVVVQKDTSKAAPPPPPPAPTTSSSVNVAPPPPPPAATTSSVQVAPPPPPPPKPKTTTAAPPPPPPPSVAAPPPPPPSVAAPPPPPPPAPSSGSGSGSGGSGSGSGSGSGDHKGDLTYYAVGMGACGEDDSGKDNSANIVALSHLDMGTQSNGNPKCGKKISIFANGKSTTATVRDKCMGCKAGDIDVSEKVYKELYGDLGSGRMPVSWSYN